eukprot:g229.t1
MATAASASPDRRPRRACCNVEHATSRLVREVLVSRNFSLYPNSSALHSSDSDSDGDGDDSSSDGEESPRAVKRASPLWDIYWTDKYNRLKPVFRGLRRFQRVNHFPNMRTLASKIHLARCLERLRRTLPADMGFVPRSWVLPTDFDSLRQQFANGAGRRAKGGRTFIVKPDRGACGRGIRLTRTLNSIPVAAQRGAVAQHYIARPLVHPDTGAKMDLRLFVLVMSVDPLRVYVYREGLVRVAAEPYHDSQARERAGAAQLECEALEAKIEGEDQVHSASDMTGKKSGGDATAEADTDAEPAGSGREAAAGRDSGGAGSRFNSRQATNRDADLEDSFVHLTNTSVNKKHRDFGDENTRTLSWLIGRLRCKVTAGSGEGRSVDKGGCEGGHTGKSETQADDGGCSGSESHSESEDEGKSDCDSDAKSRGDLLGGTTDAIATSRADLDYDAAAVDTLWARLADVCVKTMLAAQPALAQAYRTAFPHAHAHSHCFELLGVDILLDSALQPWLLEVNDRPSFVPYTRADEAVKRPMVADLLTLLDLDGSAEATCDIESDNAAGCGAEGEAEGEAEGKPTISGAGDALDCRELVLSRQTGFVRVFPLTRTGAAAGVGAAEEAIRAAFERVAAEATHQAKWGKACLMKAMKYLVWPFHTDFNANKIIDARHKPFSAVIALGGGTTLDFKDGKPRLEKGDMLLFDRRQRLNFMCRNQHGL